MGRIVVVGSVARDEVVRLVEPLTPGKHLNGVTLGARLGGGGANTAVALAAAGHQVMLVAAVGHDAHGDALVGELAAVGIDVSQIVRLGRPTTHSLIMVDPSGERTVVNVGRCEEDQPPKRLLDLRADVVYVRSRSLDLGPLLAAKAASCLVVAHLPPLEPASRPAQILLASASDLPQTLRGEPLALARRVAGDRFQWMVITAGAAGAGAVSEREALEAPAEVVAAVDTTGAGDAFAAGLVHALAHGWGMEKALRVAVRFGTESTLWPTSGLPPQAVLGLLAA